MSGNSHQRKIARHHRELIDLGRQAKAENETHAAAIASLHEAHASELAEVQARHEAQLEAWARSASTDADTIAALRVELQSTRELAVGLQLRLDTIEQSGLVSRREHELAVEQETAKLRERLRRANEERLAPKKILIDHTQEERRLRDALVHQRDNLGVLVEVADTVKPDGLREAATRCIGEIDGVLR